MKTFVTYKPIALTKMQRARMLAMCEELFPNRDWVFWEDDNGEITGEIGHHKCALLEDGKQYLDLSIHWIEFLIYKLIPAFSKKYGPITLTWNMKNMQNDVVNMIDEFYEKFYLPIMKD